MRTQRQRRFSRRALLVFLASSLAGVLALHSATARLYYSMNLRLLQSAAILAVRAGAVYLPTAPALAMRETDDCARLSGVAPQEIVQASVSADGCRITLSLDRKVPKSLSFLAIGLPSREVRVTASATALSGARLEVTAAANR